LGASFLVACLAMAGVPGFSIFVSEFALLSASMQVNKLLMMIIVFFVTLCFILYASYLFPALLPGKKKFETNKLVVWLCLVSALLTIVMGLSPLLQEGMVKVFTW
jgi:formate hydrogenlyase subunit 3/multisubunit Na+/H+ antiporter MnhD subunit